MKLVTYVNDDEVMIDRTLVGQEMHITATFYDQEPVTLCILRKHEQDYRKFELIVPHDSKITKVTRLKEDNDADRAE